MPSCTHLKTFILTLGLLLAGAANNAFSASSNEPKLEKVVIPLSSSPQFTFTVPMKAEVNFFLLTDKSTNTDLNSIAQIIISDKGCALGHQVSISYKKKSQEILTTYFPKEIPWDATYKLSVRQDAKTKTLTFNLNGETISVTPHRKAKFIYLVKNPELINILNIEQQQQ